MSQSAELKCCESQVEEGRTDQVVQPRVDILESADAWLLRADMPGVDETHAEVSLERQVLTISGTAELREPEGSARQFGTFHPRRYERSFRMPETIDRGGLEATVQHGVLTVRIPKAAEAQPVKVAVKGV
ncbi:MAG: Hsp20/alpha crystallin family protein [Planctomycetaceae bacterium]|nr:Hsp20/alpha crystallin family protein [Planctomycetaceae bacterium]